MLPYIIAMLYIPLVQSVTHIVAFKSLISDILALISVWCALLCEFAIRLVTQKALVRKLLYLALP